MNQLRWFVGVLLLAAPLAAQQSKAPPATQLAAPAQAVAPATLGPTSGEMTAAQVDALMEQVRFAGYRISDLLTDVRPEHYKMPAAARESFAVSLATLHEQLKSLKAWREQFQKRPDSMYLGYEVYAAINAALPRLDGVARTVSSAYSPSYGAQFDQAAGRLFDLQQKLGGYLGYLLRNQDQVVTALENNLASCQGQLSEAMRGQSGRARGVRNSRPRRPYRRVAKKISKSKEKGSAGSSSTPPRP